MFLATPLCAVDLLVVVTNAKTGAVLDNAKVAILDAKNNVIATQYSNSNGEVNYKIECDTPYSIQASKDGFEGNVFPVEKAKDQLLNYPLRYNQLT